MDNLKSFFTTNAENYKQKAEELHKKYLFYSTIRVISFLVFCVLIVYFANERSASMVGILFVASLVVFFILIRIHNKIKFDRDQSRFLTIVNQREINRMENDFSGLHTGEEYIPVNHPYAADLDIFGKHSIFQLINRTCTKGGRKLLASWLLSPSDRDNIKLRQEASLELLDDAVWRQNFQAFGMHFEHNEEQVNSLFEWLEMPDYFEKRSYYKILLWIVPIVAVVLLFAIVFLGISFNWLFPLLVVNGLILKSISSKIDDTTRHTDEGSKGVNLYANLMRLIENRSFKSALLLDLKDAIVHEGFKASQATKELKGILYSLENRANIFYWIPNILFLLDLYWLLKSESWKKKNASYAKNWFNTVHHFEVINSLSGFQFSNPGFAVAKISDIPYTLTSKSIGHPLIHQHHRVNNDFSSQGKSIIIITGSNMSGKSTFLRTVGVNLVLALSGAVVCAESFETYPFQVFTSMRTQDNLEESVSSFYAELKRLRQLLDMITKDIPVWFMLDEILKGTNSKDRYTGAASLIKQLSSLNACGFVSTHDLKLGYITKNIGEIHNYSFNSLIEDDEIIFNYKLTEGICKSFNATKLMEKMGIKISSEFQDNENE